MFGKDAGLIVAKEFLDCVVERDGRLMVGGDAGLSVRQASCILCLTGMLECVFDSNAGLSV